MKCFNVAFVFAMTVFVLGACTTSVDILSMQPVGMGAGVPKATVTIADEHIKGRVQRNNSITQ